MQTLRFERHYLRNDAVHVALDGKIDPATTVQFSGILWGVFAQGCHRILLDLSKVSSIESTGVGVLINATETARERDSLIVLINPSEKVRRVMKTLNLAPLFTFADSREAAEDMLAERTPECGTGRAGPRGPVSGGWRGSVAKKEPGRAGAAGLSGPDP